MTNAAAIEIARRRTCDGVTVTLWSDGAVTGRMGFKLPGVPVAAPRSDEGRRVTLAAGWLLAGEVELYDASELGSLYAACRWAAERGLMPGDVRARFAATQRTALRPTWEVMSTDRDGQPTSRVWRLPRILCPGVAVWDHVSVGAKNARYEVMAVDRDGVCTPTGFRFPTLAALTKHLDEVRAIQV